MNEYRPAPAYAACAEVWVVTTYYDPGGYRAKPENYEYFAAPT